MTGRSMSHEQTNHTIPASPPPEALAELDRAAAALAALEARGARVTLGLDERSPGVRIALEQRGSVRQLTPTQLVDLLS